MKQSIKNKTDFILVAEGLREIASGTYAGVAAIDGELAFVTDAEECACRGCMFYDHAEGEPYCSDNLAAACAKIKSHHGGSVNLTITGARIFGALNSYCDYEQGIINL